MVTNNSVNEPTAASGKVLQGQGIGTASNFSTATYPSTATGTGKILYADGTNWVASTPTFPASASETARKMTVSDGTNWVASTETWAVPGTTGNVLTSDGTNWTSAAASGGGITSVSGTLTNAQIKALHGTPVQVIAAPGSGKVIQVIYWTLTMNYGGTNVFTAAAGQTISVYYGTSSNLGLMSATQITASSSQVQGNAGEVSFGGTASTYSTISNAAINLYNPAVTEIAGNAANNNTVSYNIVYRTITIP